MSGCACVSSGVGVSIVPRYTERAAGSKTLQFMLPPPSGSHLAAHYYLNATIDRPAGDRKFARGTLFYFWIDTAAGPRPAGRADVTRLGVRTNSSAAQTAVIQHLLDTVAVGTRIFFPYGRYITAELSLHRSGVGIDLAEGTLLQHPGSTGGPAARDSSSEPPPNGNCQEKAFLTVSQAADVYIGGRGATIDANGFPGSSLCIADSSNVTLESVLLRGSCSWSTHIFRSSTVTASGIKIFSGADGFDPDNSQDVTLDSCFVHSNDDAVAVKATTHSTAARTLDTVRVTISNALFSTKKSCLKLGTESLANFRDILFTDVEGFNLDRGMVLYPSDGGSFTNVRWQRVRFSSFYDYKDEAKRGMVWDFAEKHRGGLSQLSNITATGIDSVLRAPSLFKGVPGAPIQGVSFADVTLRAEAQFHFGGQASRPVVFGCQGERAGAIEIEGLTMDWGGRESEWEGLQEKQSNGSSCVRVVA